MKLIPRLTIMLILTVAAAVAVVPLVWLILATFKRGEDILNYPLLPWSHFDRLTLANYRAIFAEHPFRRWLINSLFLASSQTCLLVTLSSMGGFALAKYRFAGKRTLSLLMLLTLLLPAQVLVPSTYELIWHFGWVDSYKAILIPGAVSVFGIFLFRQAMLHVPDELLHAARVDGCSEIRLWWEIALPIVRPMIGAFTLLSFLASWNSFLWPQVVLQDELKYTLPIGLTNMMSQAAGGSDYPVLMCATLVSILPVIVLFFALQKEFISGLTSGAVKG